MLSSCQRAVVSAGRTAVAGVQRLAMDRLSNKLTYGCLIG
jgi:hypothetical protein